MSNVAVTGATGYVGGVVATALEAAGHRVIELGRRSSGNNEREYRFFALGEEPAEGLLEGADALVHAAWDLKALRSDAWLINVAGSRRLIEAAGDQRVVFVSSMSAYDGTRQAYGLQKLAIERAVLTRGGAVVRPGLVHGAEAGGMLGALARAAALPVVPVPAASALQRTVHVADLGYGVVRLVEVEVVPEVPLGFAAPDAIRFGDIVAGLVNRRTRLVPVPATPVHMAMRAAEALRMSLPFRSDSLLGLMRPAGQIPHPERVAELGITFRPFNDQT